MKTFRQFLSEERIDPETYNLFYLYRVLNDELFDGQLPLGMEVKFGTVPKPAVAQCDAKVRKRGRQMDVIPGTISITVSRRMFDEEKLKGLLVHEMIHAWFFVNNRPDVSHGYEFLHKLRELQTKVPYKIPLTDSDNDPEEFRSDQIKEVGIVLVDRPGGKISFALVNPKVLSAMKDKLPEMVKDFLNYNSSRATGVQIGLAKTHIANSIPVQRKADRLTNLNYYRFEADDPVPEFTVKYYPN